jgi:hypothetical protein
MRPWDFATRASLEAILALIGTMPLGEPIRISSLRLMESASLPGWSRDRHQGGRPSRRGQILDSCSFPPGANDRVHDNLRNLGLDVLVNLRVGGVTEPSEGSIEEPLAVLTELKRQGLIRHIGLSNVTAKQFAQAQSMTETVCVQNFYNVAHRNDDALFPLGGC